MAIAGLWREARERRALRLLSLAEFDPLFHFALAHQTRCSGLSAKLSSAKVDHGEMEKWSNSGEN